MSNCGDNRCQARIWGTIHDGWERCFFSAGSTGLCTKHAKAEAVCATPCTLSADGKRHIGLFYGRIDRFQEGEPLIPPYKDKDNIVRIKWRSDYMIRHIKNAVLAGSCKFPSRAFKTKKSNINTDIPQKPNKTKKSNFNKDIPNPSLAIPKSIDDAYIVLNLNSGDTHLNIKKRYYELARQFHPDKLHNYKKEEYIYYENRFKQIIAAWEILKNL